MKQTNAALKFLIAQYRAILHSANLKNIASVIVLTAGLASASAQAGDPPPPPPPPPAPTNNFDGTALADAVGDITLKGSGTTAGGKEFDSLKLEGGDKRTSSTETLNLKITGGDAHAFVGKAGKPQGQDVTEITLANTTLTIAADAGDAADTKLTIGDSKLDATVKLDKVAVTKGTLEIGASGSDKKATLQAASIVLGTAKPAKAAPGAATEDAIVNLNKNATLGSASSTIDVLDGSKVSVAGTGSKIVGTLNLKGGSIEATNGFTIDGKLNASSGSFATVKSQAVNVNKKAEFTGKDVLTNSGTMVFKGGVVFADGSVKESKGSVRLAGTADMSAKTLNTLLSGTDVSAAKDSTAVINVSGATVDLSDSADGLGLIASGNGAIKTGLTAQSNGSLTVNFNKGVFNHNTVSGDSTKHASVSLSFNELELGDGTNAVEVQSANLKVASGLTVSGDKDLQLSSGSNLTLAATDSASHTVGAAGITLGTATTKAPGTAGNLKIEGGKWSVKNLTINSGEASIVDSELKITGDLETKASTKLNASGASTIDTIGGGKVTLVQGAVDLKGTSVLKLESKDIFNASNEVQKSSLADGSIAGTSSTVIEIDKDGKNLDMTKAQFKALKDSQTGFNGLYRVNITDLPAPTEGMDIGQVQENVTTNKYENTGVKVDAGATGVNSVYSVGNVTVKDNADLTIGTNGGLTLSKPNAAGQFVTKNDGKDLAGVSLGGAASELTLNGNGEIGAIKNGGSATGEGILNVGGSKTSSVTVKGAIGETSKAVAGVAVDNGSKLGVEGDVFTKDLSIASGSLDAGTNKVEVSGKATIMGNVDAASLSFANSGNAEHLIAGNSEINVDSLSVGANNTLLIGQDKIDEKNLGSTASVYTADLRLSDSSVVFVDPEYHKKAAILAAKTVNTVAASTPSTDVGTVSGKIYVGQNAALGIGFTQEEFEKQMATYVDADGSFAALDEEGMHNALVLNMPVELANNAAITVNPELKHKDMAANTSTNALTVKNGSVVLTDKAFGEGKQKAAITFSSAATTSTVDISGGSIELVGDFSTKDKDIKFFSGTGLKITNAIKVTAMGGLLEGTIDADTAGTSTAAALNAQGFALAADAEEKAHAGVSRSIGDMFIGMANGTIEVDSSKNGHYFVTQAIGTDNGFKKVDAAAHAATYAGAQQAAVAVVGTMAEAVGSRVGSLGIEAKAIQTASSQLHGGVWVTPMYKSVDADGFGAEGASYGADVDLAGVSFGADSVKGNMRFGALFNIGSGDADGKGNGAGLKDEFDYYGFGIYSAMGFGPMAVVADASVNVISHDVEAAGLGLKAEADTTAVTMGVTGQYTISTPAVDVAPHFGARFIRLDTDSYKLRDAKGVVANTDFDVQNVFSIPVGVSFSKALEMGGWSLATSADLALTFNTGDTEAKSTTRFDGINQNIGLNTEVLDEVTYGITLGLGAQYGAFGTNFGINYTGSENTDAWGINAQARYAF